MMTRGKSKIFKCLRPVTADDGHFKKTDHHHHHHGLDYSSGSEHGGGRGGDGGAAAGHPKLLSMFSISRKSDCSDGSCAADNPSNRKEKSRGKFRRVLKAVLFETSLARKIRRTESFGLGRSKSRSTSNLTSKSQRISNCSRNQSFSSKGFTDLDKFSRMSSNCSSVLSSSMMSARDSAASLTSSASYSSSLSRTASERKRQLSPECLVERSRTKKEIVQQRGRYKLKVAFSCLIICLLLLVLSGKAFAIVCISVWLYFAPLCFKAAVDSPAPEIHDPHTGVQE